MRTINEIVVHCTATQEGKDYDVADIRAWHKARGFNDIGYHFVIYRDGTIAKGRPVETAGAHVSGRNANTIGISYVGGVDAKMQPKDTRTPAQKHAMVELLNDLVIKFPSIKLISGHHDYAAKACPCFPAREEYAGLIKGVTPTGRSSLHANAAIGKARVRANGLNFRLTPDGGIIQSLANMTELTVFGADGDWLNVQPASSTKRGWVHRKFVEVLE